MGIDLEELSKGIILFVSVASILCVLGLFYLGYRGQTTYKVKYLTGDNIGTVDLITKQRGYAAGDTVIRDGFKVVIIENLNSK